MTRLQFTISITFSLLSIACSLFTLIFLAVHR